MKFSSRLLPANPWDCSLLGFSVGFVLYYFDVALLMSCEISCAEHSVPWAHSCVWHLWERVTAELHFAIWMVSFPEALQGQRDCKSLLGIFKGLTKELKSSISIGEGWQPAAVLTYLGVWDNFGTKELRGWGQVKCSRFCRQRQLP